jgi:hypothetical protein
MKISPLTNLRSLPQNLPLEGAVRMELVEGVPIFRATSIVQTRIEVLIAKQQDTVLSLEEEEELDCYEEVDDYLSFVNRMVRNTSCSQAEIDDPVQTKA